MIETKEEKKENDFEYKVNLFIFFMCGFSARVAIEEKSFLLFFLIAALIITKFYFDLIKKSKCKENLK